VVNVDRNNTYNFHSGLHYTEQLGLVERTEHVPKAKADYIQIHQFIPNRGQAASCRLIGSSSSITRGNHWPVWSVARSGSVKGISGSYWNAPASNLVRAHLVRHHPDRSSEGNPNHGKVSPQEQTTNSIGSWRGSQRNLGTRDHYTQDRRGQPSKVAQMRRLARHSARCWGMVHRHKPPTDQLLAVSRRYPDLAMLRSRTRSEPVMRRHQREKRVRSRN